MKSAFNVAHFANEGAAIEYVESRLWPDGPVCPHCGTIGNASRAKGKTTRLGLWNCRACRKPFTVKIGTVFESSHVPLHIWLQVIYLFCSSKKGFATRQIQRTLQCSMKTAWFLGHRVREAMVDLGITPDSGPLGGQNEVVESDETYVGGKAANRKNRIPKKQIVLSLVQRGGRVRSFHVPDVAAATLKPIIIANVDKATFLMTDDAPVYWPIGDAFAGHGTVNHSAEEYVRAHFWHTTPSRTSSRSSNAACTDAISTSPRRTCTDTPLNLISDTTTASRSGSMISSEPIARLSVRRASG